MGKISEVCVVGCGFGFEQLRNMDDKWIMALAHGDMGKRTWMMNGSWLD